MAGKPWTATDLRTLRRLVGRTPCSEIAGRLGRSQSACRQRALLLGLGVGTPWGDYGPEFEAFLILKHAAGWSDADIAKAWGGERRGVGKRRRRLGLASNAYNARHNAKSAATQFRKGNMRGNAARRYRAIGQISIRTDKTGTGAGRKRRFIKLRDDGPESRRYVPFARYLWETQRGPVPPGMFVVHADGDTLNDDMDNLKLIDRQHLLVWQAAIRPEVEAKRRAGASRVLRQRGAVYRARKAKRLAG